MNKSVIVRAAMIWGVAILSFSAQAESINGSSVLEQEAVRAKELQDLKYQAQLIEQRAKIAKAYQDLNGAGGYVPNSSEFDESSVRIEKNVSESVGKVVANKKRDRFKLPVLQQINGNVASFSTKQGFAEAKEGGFLPGGFRVLTVSSFEGVKLMREGIIYQVGFTWNQAKK